MASAMKRGISQVDSIGLMGEAAGEAIIPLSRATDGKLRLQARAGGEPVTVLVNTQTSDTDGFRRAQEQITAELGRARVACK